LPCGLFKFKKGVNVARVTNLIGTFSGKLGGQVFANNKGGSYVRQYKIPTNANTAAQRRVRGNFSSGSNFWKTLSAAQQGGWNTFALTNFKPRKAKPGVVYSGANAVASLAAACGNANALVRVATLRVGAAALTYTNAAYGIKANPPAYSLAPQISTAAAAAINLTLSSCTLSVTGTALATFTADQLISAAPVFANPGQSETCGLMFYASNALASANLFVQNPLIQCIGCTPLPTTVTGTIATPSNQMTINFGTTDLVISTRKLWYVVGNIVRISCYLVSSTGQAALIGSVNTTVTT
jgi:hypothetical protein